MITRDLRRAIANAVAAAGFWPAPDPGLRPTGTPGQYAASVALALGRSPREAAAALAGTLAREHWIAAAEVTGPGYLTITVTPAALSAVAGNVTRAGAACVTSEALAGETVPAAPRGDPLAASTWEKARAALAVRLTARLAVAAGRAVAEFPGAERNRLTRPVSTDSGPGVSSPRSADPQSVLDASPRPEETLADASWPSSGETAVARAVAFAGRDAVTFTLARAIPGKPLSVDPEIIARHVPGNPAYAVRYAHARAASGVRWAATFSAADTIGIAEAAALLDALSWLPERVATAARRGRPDEFARYLEVLASLTVDILSSASHPTSLADRGRVSSFDRLPSDPSGADEVRPSFSGAEDGALSQKSPSYTAGRVQRLTLAGAARAGLAAGLGLLEVSAPERLLAEIQEQNFEPCRPPGRAASWGRAAR